MQFGTPFFNIITVHQRSFGKVMFSVVSVSLFTGGEENGQLTSTERPSYYRPQMKFGGKVMFLHLSVILFTGGGYIPARNGADNPIGRHPPGKTPRILWDTVNKRAVRILLECILVKHVLTSKDKDGV